MGKRKSAIEVWAVVDYAGFFSVFPSISRPDVEKAWAEQKQRAFNMGPGTESLVRFVPAQSPAAKELRALKAVARAAERYVKRSARTGAIGALVELRALVLTTERLSQLRKTKR